MGKWYEDETEEELGRRGRGSRRSRNVAVRTPKTATRPWASAGARRAPAATGRWAWNTAPARRTQRRPRWSGLWPRNRWSWLVPSQPWGAPAAAWPHPYQPAAPAAAPEPAYEPPPPAEPPNEPAAAAEPGAEPEPQPPAEEPRDAAASDGGAEPAAEPQQEYRARLGNVSATVVRWERKTLSDFALTGIPRGGGVYIVTAMIDGVERPLYVGEADVFRTRWHKRLLEVYQLGLIGKGRLPVPITAWFGTMAPVPSAQRRSVETVLIRTLLLSGIAVPAALRNGRQYNPFEITGSIAIRNLLPDHWARQVKPGAARALTAQRRGARTAEGRRHVTSLETLQRGFDGRNLNLPRPLAGTLFELPAFA